MSFSNDIKSFIGNIAPVIGTALGSPVAGMAIKALSNTLLGKDDATIPEIEKALRGASPEQLAQIKQIDNDFALKMKELDIDLVKIAEDGIASARAREIAVKDKVPALLATLVTFGFFTVLGFMLYDDTAIQSDALLVMLGALGSGWGAVFNYYFGSSSGSAKKNDLIAGLKNGR